MLSLLVYIVPTLLTSLGVKALSPSAIQVAQLSEAAADVAFRSGMQAFQTNEYKTAIALWQAALEKFQGNGEQESSALTLNALAAAALSLGRYGEAIAYSHKSTTLARRLNHSELVARGLGSLGIVYQASGRYTDAIHTYKQALKLLESAENSPVIAQLYSLLGSGYQAVGEYTSAIAAQEISFEIAAAVDSPALEATVQITLGDIYSEQGDYSTAIAWYEQGITLARDFGFLGAAAYGLNNLGGTYQQLGQADVAILQFRKSLGLAQQVDNRALQATVLTNLGIAYESTNAFELALTSHQAGVAIARSIEEPRLMADVLNNLAHAQLQVSALPEAEAALLEAITLLVSLGQGLTDHDKLTVFDTQTHSYSLLMQVQVAQGNYVAALEAAEQSRAHAFAAVAPPERATLSPPTFQQIKRIARDLNATFVEYAVIPKDCFPVQERRRSAVKIFVWVVTPTGEIAFESISWIDPDTSLEDQIKQSRIALGALGWSRDQGVIPTDPVTASLQALSASIQLRTVYDCLITPIADLLPENPDDLVIIIPHESLFYVPFAALQDSEGSYLIERHTIAIAPAIQQLGLTLASSPLDTAADMTAFDAVTQALVVGNSVMPVIPHSQTLQPQPLPKTKLAAEEIAHILQTEVILGRHATKSEITTKMQAAQVIHLATCGLLDYVDTEEQIPVSGAITFTPSHIDDGLLTARNIANIPLIAELVVLSACDTELGEVTGAGIVGLSRSLIAAGAKSAVVSLWSMPDEPTALLMGIFYERLQQGDNKAQALRHAMLQAKALYPNPLVWAAFTLVGNPRPLVFTSQLRQAAMQPSISAGSMRFL